MNIALDISGFEKREERTLDDHHDNLTAVQIEKVYTMSKFGYSLYFVRELDNGRKLAVLSRGEELSSVNFRGEINFNPDVTLRN
jgi:hypothetical protein